MSRNATVPVLEILVVLIHLRVTPYSWMMFQDSGNCSWQIWTLLKIYRRPCILEIRLLRTNLSRPDIWRATGYFWDSSNQLLHDKFILCVCCLPLPPPQQEPHVHLSSYFFLNPALPLGIPISPPQLFHSFRVRDTLTERSEKVPYTERSEHIARIFPPPLGRAHPTFKFAQRLDSEESEFSSWKFLFRRRDLFFYFKNLFFNLFLFLDLKGPKQDIRKKN